MADILHESEASRKRLGNAIGAFALDFEYLEKSINWAIMVMIPIDTQAKADLLLGPIFSVDTRLNILESLVNGVKMDNAIRSDLLDIVAAARDLNGFRNWLLHGRWGG